MTAFDRLVERLDGVRGRGSTAMAHAPPTTTAIRLSASGVRQTVC